MSVKLWPREKLLHFLVQFLCRAPQERLFFAGRWREARDVAVRALSWIPSGNPYVTAAANFLLVDAENRILLANQALQAIFPRAKNILHQRLELVVRLGTMRPEMRVLYVSGYSESVLSRGAATAASTRAAAAAPRGARLRRRTCPSSAIC